MRTGPVGIAIRTWGIPCAALALSACGQTVFLGSLGDDATGVPDADVDGAGDAVAEDGIPGTEDGGTDGEDLPEADVGDGESDDVPVGACPVWAVPSPTGLPEEGTEDRPIAGIQRAVDLRGTCDRIVLKGHDWDDPFDARVDIDLAADEPLVLEGDPDDSLRAALDAADGPGLSVSGEGSLTLRRLEIRNGLAAEAACAFVRARELAIDDTVWASCRCTEDTAILDARADSIDVQRSSFVDNAVSDEDLGVSAAGALLVVPLAPAGPTPTDVGDLVVRGCRFERNSGFLDGALHVHAAGPHAEITGCTFADNQARTGGSALWATFRGTLAANRFERNESTFGSPTAISAYPETRILHNVFLENRGGVGAALELNGAYGTIRNNLFVRNEATRSGGAALCLWDGAPDVANNTFVDDAGHDAGAADISVRAVFGRIASNLLVGGRASCAVGTSEGFGGPGVDVAYNAWWNGPGTIFGDGLLPGTGNLSADPRFVDPDSDDHRLGAGSACIDAGDPDPASNDPDGSRGDVGAFGGPDGAWDPSAAGAAP